MTGERSGPQRRSKRDDGSAAVRGVAAEARNHRVAVQICEVDEEPAAQHEVRREREAEQSTLAAGRDHAPQIEEVPLDGPVTDEPDPARLLNRKERRLISRILHERHRRLQAGDEHGAARHVRRCLIGEQQRGSREECEKLHGHGGEQTLRYDPLTVNMRRLLFASFVTSLIVVAACGGDSDPPSSGGSSGGGETITGRERFGWSQAADVAGDLSFYKYALYVDGQRRVIEGENCSLNAAATAVECTAPLPALGAGRHTLALAAFFTVGDTVVEGARSPVLDVTVAGATAPAGAPIVQGGPFESSDGLLLHADILARDLSDPIDIAVAPDSRVFVAERRGRVRMFSDNGEESARRDDNLLDALRETIETDSAAVLAITLSPDFATSRVLHVAYATMARGEPVVRVVRTREVAGALGQTAVLLTYPVPSIDLPAVMRFGPDARLYLAIGGGGARPDDPTTVAGRLQRLGADGTTPDDSPGGSPVMSAGHQAPRGLVCARRIPPCGRSTPTSCTGSPARRTTPPCRARVPLQRHPRRSCASTQDSNPPA